MIWHNLSIFFFCKLQITLLKFGDDWILHSKVLKFGFYPLKFGVFGFYILTFQNLDFGFYIPNSKILGCKMQTPQNFREKNPNNLKI